MSDWADEEAQRIEDMPKGNIYEDPWAIHRQQVASALRAAHKRGMVEGMREAGSIDVECYWSAIPGDNYFDIDRFQNDLLASASAIEQENT